ncbi:MAG: peptidylprolyl isomerase [Planctomycetes bacterium]|nr:peptidylprolyl isomerase [Planctomycetota bacterium]MCP4771492.1 peptidylprolyl isomerase [Planctomycetota bacterium]MCP4861153.1 peptidylprolyl isomerase [Planctomycetota bacterium]
MTDLNKPHDLDDAALKDVLLDVKVSVGGEDVGTITLEFWPETAPATVRNFLRYAAEGFYNGKTFHRVISGFMVQGGCPIGRGTGSGSYGNIPGEFSGDKQYTHVRGVISMARSADPNSASCQFFICHGAADFLDGQYAAFGRMIEGDSALDKLAGVATGGGGENSTPMEPCLIQAMTLRSRV